jgi:hypothetical protein
MSGVDRRLGVEAVVQTVTAPARIQSAEERMLPRAYSRRWLISIKIQNGIPFATAPHIRRPALAEPIAILLDAPIYTSRRPISFDDGLLCDSPRLAAPVCSLLCELSCLPDSTASGKL